MKVYIKTWGCSANHADSEYIAGLLSKQYELVDNVDDAEVVILNSCSVKTPSENSLLKEVRNLSNKRVIVTGCVPEANKELIDTELKDVSIVGLNAIEELPKVIESGERVVLFKSEKLERGGEKVRINPIVEIVNISTGCLNKCSYCATKLAKGNLFSYSIERIVSQIKNALKDGVKEVWLTSQDCAIYGFDRGTNLARLLEEVCAIEGDFKIRVGMANPQHLLKFLDELISSYKHEKVYKFLHVPIQSGSDKVLKIMLRKGMVEEFKHIINKFREEIPKITIATDIICGYPTESKEDWKATLDLIKWLNPDVLNISKFWPRPGTEAAKLVPLNGAIVKQRSKELTGLFDGLVKDKNKEWIGWQGEVLINEKGQKGGMMGRNFAYRPVVVLSDSLIIGNAISVKIDSSERTHLMGKIIKKK